MSAQGNVVVRNLVYGVLGEAGSGLLNFFTFILIARSLGPEIFGTFSYILALVGVFQLVADFGITNILVREVSRARERVGEVMGALRPLAWASSILVVGLIAAVGWPLAASRDEYVAILLLGLSLLATFHSFSFASVCRAFEEMGYNALGNLLHKLLQVGLVVLALERHAGLIGIGAAMLVANSFQWFFFQTVVKRRYLRHIVWRYDFAYWNYLLREAVPLGMAMVLRRANQQVGILLLTLLSTTGSVGLFSAAYKIIQVVDMIPFTLSIPLFPPMARLAKESKTDLFELVGRALRMFLILASPVAIWLFVMAPWVMRLVFGDYYLAAVPTLQTLALAVLFLFATSLYAYLFSALGQQRFYTLIAGGSVLVNLLMDLALIPFYGHLGAALAVLISELSFCAGGLWMLHRAGFRASLWTVVARPLLLALVLAPVLFAARTGDLFMVIAGSLLFGLAYLGLVATTGTLDPREQAFVRALLSRRTGALSS